MITSKPMITSKLSLALAAAAVLASGGIALAGVVSGGDGAVLLPGATPSELDYYPHNPLFPEVSAPYVARPYVATPGVVMGRSVAVHPRRHVVRHLPGTEK